MKRLSHVSKSVSDWHRNIGWGIAGLFGAALLGLVTWYIPKESASLRESVKSDTASQIEPLKIQMAQIQGLLQLKQSKNVSDAIRLGVNFSEPKYASVAVKAIAEQARTEHIETAPYVLADASERLLSSVKSDPDLIAPVWSAQVALVDYRSSLPIQRPPDVTSPPRNDLHLFLMDGGGISNGHQKLDGLYLRNFVLENVVIEYDGGPLMLENVAFINCTFKMRYTVPSEKFAGLLLNQQTVTGSLS